ncbi:hypothetical protein GQX74_001385 [Glossina fuscipes]|nr:hypothetical protein GQX74_001385 [Glossina fuscipes]
MFASELFPITKYVCYGYGVPLPSQLSSMSSSTNLYFEQITKNFNVN